MVKQTIQIFCRVKPTKQKTGIYSVDEDEIVSKSNIEFLIPKDLAAGFINNKKEAYKFSFQKVFDQLSKQEDVFDHVAKGVADNVLSGYNGTIFAYGQTGSGKTFTITGGAERYSDRGIIPRALSYIFEKYEQDKDHLYTTEISYLEIYNENGYDLLDPRHEAAKLEDLPKVALMEDPDQNVHLRNLSVLPAQNEEEALNHLFLGDTNRMIAETPMNQASTRSHCIFTIHVTSREPGSATIRRSKLHLVDLAGSERVSKSQVGGQLLTEAKYINLSLHFLEQVIVALSDKKRQHIPYRNSMMTSVLRDSLGGNCMTTMIATVSVDKRNVDETISTCRFAQRVALIKNEATLNEELDPKLMILRLKREVQTLKDELSLVTGEQRTDQLTQDETERLNDLLKTFLADDDLECSLDVGGDMRKIQYCYQYLKRRIKERPDPKESPVPSDVPPENANHPPTLSPLEVQRLREILQQRDNEISILVNMLKKERKRALEIAHQQENGPAAVFTNPPLEAQKTYVRDAYKTTDEESSEMRSHRSRIKHQSLSTGKQEAFEIFKLDYPHTAHIVDQKELLKHRYAEAKSLGQEVNAARNEINNQKTSLEQLRQHETARGDLNVEDSFEDNEREQAAIARLEESKARYKQAFTRLKAMKAEIDHLHHLLDKARLQMQRDFEEWWQDQTSKNNSRSYTDPERSVRSSKPPTPSSLSRKKQQAWRTPPLSAERDSRNTSPRGLLPPSAGPISPLESSLSRGHNALGDLRQSHSDARPRSRSSQNRSAPDLRPDQGRVALAARFSKSADRRTDFSPEIKSNSPANDELAARGPTRIPLTGDQETDANILAFIKARESIMQEQRQAGNR